MRRFNTGHAGDLTEALAKRAGELPVLPTFLGDEVSTATVGMDSSLGREGALKKSGAAIASRLSIFDLAGDGLALGHGGLVALSFGPADAHNF